MTAVMGPVTASENFNRIGRHCETEEKLCYNRQPLYRNGCRRPQIFMESFSAQLATAELIL